jgi:hypothetical protein
MTMTLRLAVPLTPEGKDKVTDQLSSTLEKIDAIKEDKKAATSGFNKELKSLDALVHSLNNTIITKTVEEEVPIEETVDLFRGVVVTIRLDTNQPVKERPLDPEERQMNLSDSVVPGDLIDMEAERARRTEEQNVAGSPEEAEEIRNRRLSDEAAERAAQGEPKLPEVGDLVHVRPSEEAAWQEAQVTVRTELSFQASVDIGDAEEAPIFDIGNHNKSWRWPLDQPDWEDQKAAAEEQARLDEIGQLEAEQDRDAAAGPKTLLKKPDMPPRPSAEGKKKSSKGKRMSVNDRGALCPRGCKEKHKHTEDRTSF